MKIKSFIFENNAKAVFLYFLTICFFVIERQDHLSFYIRDKRYAIVSFVVCFPGKINWSKNYNYGTANPTNTRNINF